MMNKVFRRSLLSLTAASAMVSGVYANNAKYLDVKVNYLAKDNKALLGVAPTTTKSDSLVEITVTVLGDNGVYATKDKDGKSLGKLKVKRGTTDLTTTTDTLGGNLKPTINSVQMANNQLVKNRELKASDNIARFVISYHDYVTAGFKDTLMIEGGGHKKSVMIDLKSQDAKGLIVRASTFGGFNSLENTDFTEEDNKKRVVNALVSDLKVSGDANLDMPSQKAPGGIAGVTIPIKVYAIDSDTIAGNSGKFTTAPNLEGKKIVVKAYADYDNDGTATTALNSVELMMVNGVAEGEIMIKQGLPAQLQSTNYDQSLPGGLGITFLAYAADDTKINNNSIDSIKTNAIGALAFRGTESEYRLNDTIKVKSGDPVSIKVGYVDTAASKLENLWKGTNTHLYFVDPFDSNDTDGRFDRTTSYMDVDTSNRAAVEYNVSVTAVDSFGNPAYVNKISNDDPDADGIGDDYSQVAFDGYKVPTALADQLKKSDRFEVTAISDFNLTMTGKGVAGDNQGSGNSETNRTSAFVTITTSYTASGSQGNKGEGVEKLKLSYNKGVLSSTDPVELTLESVGLIENIRKGTIESDVVFDTTTKTATSIDKDSNGEYGIIAGNDYEKSNKTYQELTAKIKILTVKSETNESNWSIEIKNPDDNDEPFKDLKIGYYETNISEEGKIVTGSSYSRYPIATFDKPEKGQYLLQLSDVNTTTSRALDTTVGGTTNIGEANTTSAYIEINLTNTQRLGTIQLNSFAVAGEDKTNGFNKKANKLFNDDTLKGKSFSVTFKAYQGTRVPAYVEVSTKAEDAPTKEGDALVVGSTVDFVFSGDAVSSGDKVEIEFNTTGGMGSLTTANAANDNVFWGKGQVGIGEWNKDLTNKISTTVPGNKKLSVRLFDVNMTDNKPGNKLTEGGLTAYRVKSVKVNGYPVIWKTMADNEDTKEIIELSESDFGSASKGIYVKAVDKKAGDIAKIKINEFVSSLTQSGSKETGKDDKNLRKSSALGTYAKAKKEDGNSIITVSSKVLTGYYNIFDDKNDLDRVLAYDKYGNIYNTEETDLDQFSISATSGLEIDIDGDKDSYVNFKTESVGTEQTITIADKNNPDVKATITFTNIALSQQNTKFMITQNSGSASNIQGSEIIVKVMADGNRDEQDDTELMVMSDNKEATVRLVPVTAKESKLFRSIIDSKGGTTTETIAKTGNYYILSTDKPGKVTVSAKATIKKDKSDTKEEVKLAGSMTFDFIALDLTKPMVAKDNVKVIPGGFSVVITEDNLDTDATKLVINDVNGQFIKNGEYKGNNTYEVTGLVKGTYSIMVQAADKMGNVQNFPFIRTVTDGEVAKSAEQKAEAMLSGQSYYVVGMIYPYDLKEKESYLDWVYVMGDKAYEFKGKEATEVDPFGLKELMDVDISKLDKSGAWHIVKLTGELAGKFGWAVVKSDGSVAKKLEGVKEDGSFEYTKGLNLSAKVEGNMVTFTAK